MSSIKAFMDLANLTNRGASLAALSGQGRDSCLYAQKVLTPVKARKGNRQAVQTCGHSNGCRVPLRYRSRRDAGVTPGIRHPEDRAHMRRKWRPVLENTRQANYSFAYSVRQECIDVLGCMLSCFCRDPRIANPERSNIDSTRSGVMPSSSQWEIAFCNGYRLSESFPALPCRVPICQATQPAPLARL
jgi:hypothetical protein